MTRAQSVHNPYTPRAYVWALVLAVAGCAADAPSTDRAARSGVSFTPDQTGLAVEGTGQRIDFGRAPDGVIAALDRELGPGRPLVPDGCPAGVSQQISWGTLVLTFTEERFVGWRQGPAAVGQVCAGRP